MKKYCPKCHQVFPDTSNFCEECGGPLENVEDDFVVEQTIEEKEDVIEEQTIELVNEENTDNTLTDNNFEDRLDQTITTVQQFEDGIIETPSPVVAELPVPSDNIILCRDGKYRWVYDYGLFKNPINLFNLLKVYLLSVVVVLIGFVIYNFVNGSIVLLSFKTLKYLGITLLVTLVAVIILYYVSAAKKGLKRCMLFEMDENGLKSVELPKEFTRKEVVDWIYSVTEDTKLNPSLFEREINAVIRKATSSTFSKVKKIHAIKFFRSISLSSLVKKNRIYVQKADFDFVKDYILIHLSDKAIEKSEYKKSSSNQQNPE